MEKKCISLRTEDCGQLEILTTLDTCNVYPNEANNREYFSDANRELSDFENVGVSSRGIITNALFFCLYIRRVKLILSRGL